MDLDRAYLKFLLDIHNLGHTDVTRALGIAPKSVSGTIDRRYSIKKVLDYLANFPKGPNPEIPAKVAA